MQGDLFQGPSPPENAEENVSYVLQQNGSRIVDEIQMVDRFLGPSDLGGYEKVKTETMEYCVERTVAYNIYVRGQFGHDECGF